MGVCEWVCGCVWVCVGVCGCLATSTSHSTAYECLLLVILEISPLLQNMASLLTFFFFLVLLHISASNHEVGLK